MNEKAGSASAGFTNLVTGMAIKCAFPELDVRYHQTQIQDPVHFAHRVVSENIVAPWLRDNDFDYAKSGWQTRTLERPKPYFLSYDENISQIKVPFLEAYNAIEEDGANPDDALAYLLFGQVKLRHSKKIDLIEPRIDDIGTIVGFFENHFFASYQARGASRLPVLAVHSLYRLVMPQIKRFEGLGLANLELHSAADSQTGSTGDIELKAIDGSVFEALEIKHNISISEDLIVDVSKKLISNKVDRYYVLTTHSECGQNDTIKAKCREIMERTGCQVIANGVLPTMKYYLRLVNNPEGIFPYYTALLKSETAISFEHRVKWNDIVLKSKVGA